MPFDGRTYEVATPTITRKKFLAWARKQRPNRLYAYNNNLNCAIAQFLKSEYNADAVYVTPFHWSGTINGKSYYREDIPYWADEAARGRFRKFSSIFLGTGTTFGQLAKRLERA